jgi:UDP-N-acetylglucosamine--N-acetylmuramyl-(pentapeptide) pyrophosphoryl-undecaprenol N-acetylglucosamine transferase
MTKRKTIILAAGGTGGHFFPAQAVGEVLSSTGADVNLITDLRCQKYISDDFPFIPLPILNQATEFKSEATELSNLDDHKDDGQNSLIDLKIRNGIKHHIIDLYLSKGTFGKLIAPLKIITALFKAYTLIRKLKPDAIIGFGGYPSFPAMFVCKLIGVPTIIHEQNCFLGKVNKFFASNAKKIALSYKETNNINKIYSNKIVITGDIIRSSIKSLPKKKDFNSEIFHLFITGGSQGASFFSQLLPAAMRIMSETVPEIKIEIIQQVSKNDQQKVSDIYTSLGIKHQLSDFFFDIDKIYQKSELVIARSGASTIAELTWIGLPAIFIPFPYAAEDHQYYNGQALEKTGSSWCYRQNEISPEILATKLIELIADRNKIKQASTQLLQRKSDGSKTLADTVLKIIE